MRKYSINYKKFIPFLMLIIIISSLGIFIFNAKPAQAVDLGIVDGFKTLLGGFLLMIQELIGSLVAWMAGLAQGILNFTSLQNSQMVKDGWEITRGLVNMFFILILMVIALATILKVESYGMKTLLPKLIIAALLINFSLIFCGAIIDSAGVLTNFFIKDSKNFFENIADEMGLTTIMVGTVQEPAKKKWGCEWALLPDTTWSNQTVCNIACVASTGNSCYEIKPPKVDWRKIQGDNFWKVISALLLSIIFTIIAVFVFGALAFLLLIRVLVIWFLLILAPVAWFFWILPATKNLWEKWWNTFIKWVFFAPAAIFFIWLSVNSWLKFIKGKAPMTGGEIIEGMSNVVGNGVLESKIMPQVMAPANFIQFILACGMLIGSLIVAQKIGIYGASGAINIAKSAGKGVGRLAARPPKALATATGAGAASLTGKIMKKIPLKASQKLGRRIEARGTALKQSPEERPEHKKYSNLIKMMSDKDVIKEAKTARGVRSFIAAKELQQRKIFKTADSNDIQPVMKTLERFKADKELKTAQETRPDAIENRSEKEIVINRVVQEGNLNKLPAVALQDEELIAAISKFASTGQIGKLHDTSPDHAKNMDASLSKLVTPGSPVMSTLNVTEQDKIHFTYTSQTGDASNMNRIQKGNWAKQAGPEGLKRLQTFNPATDSEIALNLPAHQLNKIITNMNKDDVARDLVHEIRRNGTTAAKKVIDQDSTLSNL